MIVAQIFGAKASAGGNSLWLILKPSGWYFWATLIGGFIIISGYLYGIKIFNNIWLVTLTSWTALMITEIILARLVFQTIPEGNVLIGFLLVLSGFIIANL